MTRQPIPEPTATQLHRWCVFDLALDCGHLATVAVDGWYPVTVACCDRLGGTIARGVHVPYTSRVEYVNVLVEGYRYRPAGTPRPPVRLLNRRSRTDRPHEFGDPWTPSTAGRFPARVGATWTIDGPTAPPAAGN